MEDDRVEFRKTYYKNDLRKEILKQEFDKNKIFTTSDNLTEEEKIYKERVDVADEEKELKSDLLATIKAKRAIIKIADNETPKKNEYKSLEKVKEKYESFFEEEEVGTKKEIEEKLNEIDDVQEYISEELNVNRNRYKSLKEIKLSTESVLKRKRDPEILSDDEESISSKKSRLSISDYIDNLPKDYNPLDDIGDD